MSTDARALVRRCLDGLASDAEAAELSRLVTADAAVARELAAAAAFESSLEVVLRAETAPEPVAVASAAAEVRGAPARRRVAWAVAGGVTAAAAALAVAWSLRDGGRAGVTGAAGGPAPAATVARHEEPRPATASIAAADPTAAGGAAASPGRQLRFADGSIAELRDADSRVETRLASAAAIDVDLLHGGARFVVAPRGAEGGGRRFRIWVGSSYIDAAGAAFTAARMDGQSGGGARVAVERGVVSVVSGQHRMRLTAGAAEVIPAPAPAAMPLAAADGRARRVASASATAATPAARPPRDEPRALLRASDEARRSGHPEEALAHLRRVVDHHPRDPRAAYAAFILGRVLLEELARPGEAAAAFAQVAALDPRTPLVPDALAREVESWARAGDLVRAGARAREYLARYPNGRRADEVRRYSRTE